MSVLARVTAMPLYAQVCLADADRPDFPEWNSADDRVAVSSSAVLVGTRDDRAGNVDVEVRLGEPPPTDDNMELIHSGPISFAEGRALAGNIVASTTRSFRLAPGTHRLRVYVDGEPRRVSRVVFLLDERKEA